MKQYNGDWQDVAAPVVLGAEDGLRLADTQFDDLATTIVGKRLSSSVGKVQQDYDELSIVFEPNGNPDSKLDTIGFSLQKMHAIKQDSVARLHIHWVQKSTHALEFTVRYRIQENGKPKTTAWTGVICPCDSTTNAFPYDNSGEMNQITPLVDIDWSAAGLSSTLQIKITRTDSVSENIEGTFVDVHVEYNALGSRTEYSK